MHEKKTSLVSSGHCLATIVRVSGRRTDRRFRITWTLSKNRVLPGLAPPSEALFDRHKAPIDLGGDRGHWRSRWRTDAEGGRRRGLRAGGWFDRVALFGERGAGAGEATFGDGPSAWRGLL